MKLLNLLPLLFAAALSPLCHAQDKGLLPLPGISCPAVPAGHWYVGHLQGTKPNVTCSSAPLAQWPTFPTGGGPVNVTATACKPNSWYLCIVGDQTVMGNPPSNKGWRTAGGQGFTGTPSFPVAIAEHLVFNTATCFYTPRTPFHGVQINSYGKPVSINLLASHPIFGSGDTPAILDPCQVGVYRIDYTPTAADAGRTITVDVIAQILLSPGEATSGWYESAQTTWTMNIQVLQGTNCPNVVTAGITTPSANVTIASGASQQFTGTGTDSSSAATLTYHWNFGDGATTTTTGTSTSTSTVSHTYTNTGTTAVNYTASLSVSDNTSATSVAVTRVITVDPAPRPTFTITATAGVGGTISPSGAVSVPQGGSQTFTITPNSGYQILNVTADGSSFGATSSFTFGNVQAAHTIGATFQQSSPNAPIATATTTTIGMIYIPKTQSFEPVIKNGLSVDMPSGVEVISKSIYSEDGTERTDFNWSTYGRLLSSPFAYTNSHGVFLVHARVVYSDGTIGLSNVITLNGN